MIDMALSQNENLVLRTIVRPVGISNFGGGIEEGSGTYIDTFSKEASDMLGKSEKSVKGIVLSLCKKGLFDKEDSADGTWITITDEGQAELETLKEFLDNASEQEDEVVEEIAKIDDKPVVSRASTSHSECTHPVSGVEGKKARAKCRADRAKAAKAADTVSA